MRLIYIILAHTNTDQIMRLVQRLNTPQTRFLIHVSQNPEPGVYAKLVTAAKQYPNIAFSKRTSVRWGNFAIIQALLNCFEWIYKQDIEYDLAYVLSGQDYPIKSNSYIQQKLSSLSGKQIMEYFPLPAIDRGHGEDRYLRYHFWLGSHHIHLPLVHSPSNIVLRLASWIPQILLPKRSVPDGLKLYGGSFWSAFTPQAVNYLHTFSQSPEGKKLKRFFKINLHPAEMYLQTTLLNSPLKDTVTNLNLHHVKFPPESGHPVFFTANDFNELAEAPELFARKFDTRLDATILDMLDERLQTN
ncbi:MAG: beta-1,6-N-acetylglucosaminyltransferase [Anaerolineaceae bacterium]|nr:beta-1,6-N-acetylglucosaminyltransferase [Anaerolineaceae bacterium]